MMCLGWRPKPTCFSQGDVPYYAAECPKVPWFWALAAALGLGLIMGPGKGPVKDKAA